MLPGATVCKLNSLKAPMDQGSLQTESMEELLVTNDLFGKLLIYYQQKAGQSTGVILQIHYLE